MKPRFLALLILLSLTLSACLSLAEDITPPPGYVAPTPAPTLGAVFPASAPDVNSGAAIYAEKCAPCHGATGQGDGAQAANLPVKVPALGTAEVASLAAPARWYTIVTEGNMQNFMPPFASLSDQQRWDVVAYALSLNASAEQVQAGKALYEVNCLQCHGVDGRQLPEANLASQETMAKLSNQEIVGLIQTGVPPAMPASNLGNVDAANLAAYVRTFTFASSGAVAAVPATPQPVSETPEASSPESGTPASEPTPAEQLGKISGQVTNGSGGEIPSGLKAVLHSFEHNLDTQQFIEGDLREVSVSSTGAYEFDAVPLTSTSAYYVSIDFGGTIYESSPAIPGQDGLTDYVLPITIYDTTTDPTALVITSAHILYDYSQPGKIQVVEFFIITNNSGKTVVAAEAGGPVVTIPLPAGYQNLQFEDGSSVGNGRFIQTADGFADTASVMPTSDQNQYSLVFAFDLPYEADTSPLAFLGGKKFELSQQFNLKVEAVNLLVPVGVKADGANFVDSGTQNMGNGFTFQLYKAGAITAGQTFTAKTSGTPSTSVATSTTTNSNQNVIIGIGAFGVALILAGIFFYWRERRAKTDEDELDDENDEEDLSQEDVLDAIIALDDQYRAGNLTEDAYKERRAELKAMVRNDRSQ